MRRSHHGRPTPTWQRGYNEQIIRKEKALDRIRGSALTDFLFRGPDS
jgi:hypothetical protein